MSIAVKSIAEFFYLDTILTGLRDRFTPAYANIESGKGLGSTTYHNPPFEDLFDDFAAQQEAARLRGEEEGRLSVALRRAREEVVDLVDFTRERELMREPREVVECPPGTERGSMLLGFPGLTIPGLPTSCRPIQPVEKLLMPRVGLPVSVSPTSCPPGEHLESRIVCLGSGCPSPWYCAPDTPGKAKTPIDALRDIIGGIGGGGGRGGPLPIGTVGTRLAVAEPKRASPFVTILILAGVAGIGYWLWKKYGKKGD